MSPAAPSRSASVAGRRAVRAPAALLTALVVAAGFAVLTAPACASGGAAPVARLSLRGLATDVTASPRSVPVSWSSTTAGARFDVEVRRTSGSAPSAWRTLLAASSKDGLEFHGQAGASYQFAVRAIAGGHAGAWRRARVVLPTAARAPGAALAGHWRAAGVAGAWEGRAVIGTVKGSTYSDSFRGTWVGVIGGILPAGGRARVVLDGVVSDIDLRSAKHETRQVLFCRGGLSPAVHHLKVTVLSGEIPIEGLAIGDLR